jgi:hypothetical protein
MAAWLHAARLYGQRRKPLSFLPCQFLVRTGKARSSSRPCTAGAISERPEAVKTRLLARDRKIFCPYPLAKNTGPAFDRRGRGDTIPARRGRSPLKTKTPALLGCPKSPSCCRNDSARIETGKLSTPGRANYR